MIDKLVGWRHYTESSDWDLLVKLNIGNRLNIPRLNRFIFTIRKYRRLANSLFFFRFIRNVFLRHAAYRFFVLPEKKRKAQQARSPSKVKKQRLFSVFYTFRIGDFRTLLFSYAMFFTVLIHDEILYIASRKKGNYGVSLVLKEFNAYNMLHLHNFLQDGDWEYRAYLRIIFCYKGYTSLVINSISSSLFKIYRHKIPTFILL